MSSAYHLQQANQYDSRVDTLRIDIEEIQRRIQAQESALSAFTTYQATYNDNVNQLLSNLTNIGSFSSVEVLSYRAQE